MEIDGEAAEVVSARRRDDGTLVRDDSLEDEPHREAVVGIELPSGEIRTPPADELGDALAESGSGRAVVAEIAPE